MLAIRCCDQFTSSGLYQIDYEDGDSDWTQIPSDGIEVIDGSTGRAADDLLATSNVAQIPSDGIEVIDVGPTGRAADALLAASNVAIISSLLAGESPS